MYTSMVFDVSTKTLEAKPEPAKLLSLPNEILLQIAEEIDDPKYIYSLIRTNRRLARLLTSALWQLACRSEKFSRAALFWASASQNEALVTILLEKNLTLKSSRYANNLRAPWARDSRKSKSNTVTFILNQGANLAIYEHGCFYSATGDGSSWASGVNHQKLLSLLMRERTKGRIVIFLAMLTVLLFLNSVCLEMFNFSLIHLMFSALWMTLKMILLIVGFLSRLTKTNSVNVRFFD